MRLMEDGETASPSLGGPNLINSRAPRLRLFQPVCCPRETVSANAQAKMSVESLRRKAGGTDATDDERPATRRGDSSADGRQARCRSGRPSLRPQRAASLATA